MSRTMKAFMAGIAVGYMLKGKVNGVNINELMEQAREKLASMGILPEIATKDLNGGAARLLADYEAEYGPTTQEELDALKAKIIHP